MGALRNKHCHSLTLTAGVNFPRPTILIQEIGSDHTHLVLRREIPRF